MAAPRGREATIWSIEIDARKKDPRCTKIQM